MHIDNVHPALRRASIPSAGSADLVDGSAHPRPAARHRLGGRPCRRRAWSGWSTAARTGRAPLSAGVVVDGTIECAYHGYRYDGSRPLRARPRARPRRRRSRRQGDARTRPLGQERYGLVWLAPGGAGDRASSTCRSGTTRTSWSRRCRTRCWAAGAAHMTENFLDMGHLAFIHAKTFGDPDATEVPDYTVDRDGWTFVCDCHHSAKLLADSDRRERVPGERPPIHVVVRGPVRAPAAHRVPRRRRRADDPLLPPARRCRHDQAVLLRPAQRHRRRSLHGRRGRRLPARRVRRGQGDARAADQHGDAARPARRGPHPGRPQHRRAAEGAASTSSSAPPEEHELRRRARGADEVGAARRRVAPCSSRCGSSVAGPGWANGMVVTPAEAVRPIRRVDRRVPPGHRGHGLGGVPGPADRAGAWRSWPRSLAASHPGPAAQHHPPGRRGQRRAMGRRGARACSSSSDVTGDRPRSPRSPCSSSSSSPPPSASGRRRAAAHDVATALGAGRARRVWSVQLPAAWPAVVDGLKLAAPGGAGRARCSASGTARRAASACSSSPACRGPVRPSCGRPRCWRRRAGWRVYAVLALARVGRRPRRYGGSVAAGRRPSAARHRSRAWIVAAEVLTVAVARGASPSARGGRGSSSPTSRPSSSPGPAAVWDDIVGRARRLLSATASTLSTAAASFVLGHRRRARPRRWPPPGRGCWPA